MKFRDIEKKIKHELDSVTVPDVYSKVKIIPINKLLSTPAELFKKKLATSLLAATLAIFAVMVFCLFALWATSSKPKTAQPNNENISVMNNENFFMSNESIFVMSNESVSVMDNENFFMSNESISVINNENFFVINNETSKTIGETDKKIC